jgi:hypothetical protein
MVMTPEERTHYEAELREQDEAGFRKGAELSRPGHYDSLFDALEAEDIDSIRFYNEEIVFWLRTSRSEKDKIKKYLYGENVNVLKDEIEEIHHAIIERRELREEFRRVSGRG